MARWRRRALPSPPPPPSHQHRVLALPAVTPAPRRLPERGSASPAGGRPPEGFRPLHAAAHRGKLTLN